MRLIRVIHILYEYAESCTVVVQGHKKSRGVVPRLFHLVQQVLLLFELNVQSMYLSGARVLRSVRLTIAPQRLARFQFKLLEVTIWIGELDFTIVDHVDDVRRMRVLWRTLTGPQMEVEHSHPIVFQRHLVNVRRQLHRVLLFHDLSPPFPYCCSVVGCTTGSVRPRCPIFRTKFLAATSLLLSIMTSCTVKYMIHLHYFYKFCTRSAVVVVASPILCVAGSYPA